MPAHRKPELNVERVCPVCGDIYLANLTRLSFGRETTCSRECSYRLRGLQKEDRIQLKCGVCGKEFSRSPAKMKGKYGAHFCSRSCHYIARGLGISRRVVTRPYQYTEQGRISLSLNGARTYAAGLTLSYPQTELAVADALAALGIPFVHQQVFETDDGGISVDFFLPERGVAIEIDGSDHTHEKTIRKDAKRDEFLASAGIKVIRVPDNGSPESVRKAALAALASL